MRPPTDTELRVLAALIDRHVSITPGKRWMGSAASILAIHVDRSVPTVRRALRYWAERGLIVERGAQGCWPSQWVVRERHRRRAL